MFFISNGFNLNQKCLGGEIAAGSQLFPSFCEENSR